MLNSSPIENVSTTILYINRKDQPIGLLKTDLSCSQTNIKDNLINLIGKSNFYNNKQYALQDILKYTPNLKTHYDVTNTTDFDPFVLQGWKYTNDSFHIPDTIRYFHDLNEIFLLFKEKSKKGKSSSSLSSTKKRQSSSTTKKKTLKTMQLT